jgi:TolB-like protein
MRLASAFLALVCSALAGPPHGAAAGSPGQEPRPAPARLRYAVIPFAFAKPQRDLHWLTEGFALAVTHRLELIGFSASSRLERVEAAEQAGLSSPSPMTLASRLKLARALGADRAVTGSLSFQDDREGGATGGSLGVNALLIDVASGRIVYQRRLSGTLNQLFAMMTELALETAWNDPSPADPRAREALKRIHDPPLPAFEAVVRGVVEKDADHQGAALEAAAPAASSYPALARWLAEGLIEAGRSDEALARLKTIDPATQPDAWRLHLEIAGLLLAREDLDGALAAAARSIQQKDTAVCHVLLARLALARGDRQRASAEAALAAGLDPGLAALPALLQQIAGASSLSSP